MRFAESILLAVGLALPGVTQGQSFSQVLDLGSNIGPRLTQSVTESSIDRRLFGYLSATASWINATGGQPVVYQFSADAAWPRVLYGKKDNWVREFRNSTGPGGAVRGVTDVEVSGSAHLFVADPYRSRVLTGVFSGEAVGGVSEITAGLQHPVAVAVDGGANPLVVPSLFIVEKYLATVSYWTSSGGTWNRLWTFGAPGSGSGQFRSPSGICVSHAASSPNGTSQFGPDFYVVDAGNRRVVWLKRDGASATWKGTATLPEGWLPVSCTVDHFGVVYVADKQNHQLVSFNWYLEEITRYGSYGTGATNCDTFAYPHDVHIPFGKKIVGGQTIWYGEGRILTAEQWGPGSGGLEHWLGVEIPSATAVGTAWGPQLQYRTTGTAYITIQVFSGSHTGNEQFVATVGQDWLLNPAWHAQVWDGYTGSGQYAAPGLYHFHVSATGAYGCQGQAWCQTMKWTTPVNWAGPPAGCECEWWEICVPCEQNVALLLDGDITLNHGLPTTYRLGQVISGYQGPLLRMEGLGGSFGASAAMTGAEAVASVRASGIRALAVDVPIGTGRANVTVRLYSLTGRLVRILVDEVAEPGSYVVGWDGNDDRGRQVQPGVYVAVMTAGSFRGIKRLLLK